MAAADLIAKVPLPVTQLPRTLIDETSSRGAPGINPPLENARAPGSHRLCLPLVTRAFHMYGDLCRANAVCG